MFELEGVINSWDCCFKFLNRSLPIFLKEHVIIKPKEQKLIRVTAPFIDEISGLAIIRILDVSTYSTILIKIKFIHNTAMLDIVNNGTETIIFKPEKMIGIVDLRSLGYYKIVKEQNVRSALVYRYCMMMFPCYWVVDNSDSSSGVEQSQQRCWLWFYSFIIPCLWLCGVTYALCLLPSFLQCCWELFF